ncbi:MAG: HEAT repeat domain-containing protein, partial [Caldilineae bacterium]
MLERLVRETEMPSVEDLSIFSDLSLADWATVQQMWPTIPEARRLAMVQTLVEESYENIHLQLGRFLRVALQDTNSQVRRLAIEGLWEDAGEDLIGPFVTLLRNDPVVEVRAAAAAALGVFVLAGELDELDSAQAMRAEEALLAVLHDETEALEVQCRALESIAFSGEMGVRHLIEDGYYSPYEEMQLSALLAMGRSADTRWRGSVRAELDSPSPTMRAAAARACGELEVRAALPDLLELLLDEEPEVRLAAIFALGRLGGQDAIDALEAVSAGEDEREAQAALAALDEVLFYGDDSVPLFDEESPDDWDDWDEQDD